MGPWRRSGKSYHGPIKDGSDQQRSSPISVTDRHLDSTLPAVIFDNSGHARPCQPTIVPGTLHSLDQGDTSASHALHTFCDLGTRLPALIHRPPAPITVSLRRGTKQRQQWLIWSTRATHNRRTPDPGEEICKLPCIFPNSAIDTQALREAEAQLRQMS